MLVDVLEPLTMRVAFFFFLRDQGSLREQNV